MVVDIEIRRYIHGVTIGYKSSNGTAIIHIGIHGCSTSSGNGGDITTNNKILPSMVTLVIVVVEIFGPFHDSMRSDS
jgi:hypothetical protein